MADKAVLLCPVLLAVLSGVVVLAVEVEKERHRTIEVVADHFLVVVAVVVAAQLRLVFLNAGLVAEFRSI